MEKINFKNNFIILLALLNPKYIGEYKLTKDGCANFKKEISDVILEYQIKSMTYNLDEQEMIPYINYLLDLMTLCMEILNEIEKGMSDYLIEDLKYKIKRKVKEHKVLQEIVEDTIQRMNFGKDDGYNEN